MTLIINTTTHRVISKVCHKICLEKFSLVGGLEGEGAGSSEGGAVSSCFFLNILKSPYVLISGSKIVNIVSLNIS